MSIRRITAVAMAAAATGALAFASAGLIPAGPGGASSPSTGRATQTSAGAPAAHSQHVVLADEIDSIDAVPQQLQISGQISGSQAAGQTAVGWNATAQGAVANAQADA